LLSKNRHHNRGAANRRRLWQLWGLVCLWLLSACGYQFAGRGDLPGGIKRIAVQILENRSSETGIEITITNALVNELNRRRQGSVVDTDGADGVLSGTIDAIVWGTVSRRGINTALERRVTATLSLTLTDKTGQVLWKRSGLNAAEAYEVSQDGNKTITEANRRQAILVLSEQMAEYAYRQMIDNF
jgi:outer membrane lipopolysaccharide assembly protein LptE/RlpB